MLTVFRKLLDRWIWSVKTTHYPDGTIEHRITRRWALRPDLNAVIRVVQTTNESLWLGKEPGVLLATNFSFERFMSNWNPLDRWKLSFTFKERDVAHGAIGWDLQWIDEGELHREALYKSTDFDAIFGEVSDTTRKRLATLIQAR